MAKPKAKSQAKLQAQPVPERQTVIERYGVRSAWAHLAMCAATAVLLTLAFPLPGWSFMAWFALVPVGVLAMRTQKLWTLAWTSYLVFFIWWALRVMWLRHVQMSAPFAMASICALYFTVSLVMLAAVQRRYRGAMTLTLPIFWCAQEILRSVFPVGGFAWFTLASSQAAWRPDQSPGHIIQTADLFGWVTVSFLVAMTSGLMVDLIARPLTKRKLSGSVRPRRTVVSAALLWVLCMGGAFVYGTQRLAGAPTLEQDGVRSVVLGIVQTNVPQSNKRESSAQASDSQDGEVKQAIALRDDLVLESKKLSDFDKLLELTRASAMDEPRPDLIIWPETMVLHPINDEKIDGVLGSAGWPDMDALSELYQSALTLPGDDATDEALKQWFNASAALFQSRGYFPSSVLYYRHAVQKLIDQLRTPIVVGNSASGFASHERSMNSALLATPKDSGWRRYSKMHLVPMGEYIPGPAWIKETFLKHLSPYGPDYDYTVQPGEGVVVFERRIAGADQPVRFATPICYEAVVATQCRKMVYGHDGIKRADLLVNLTNDGWYVSPHERYQHLQLAVLRSIENRVPMARSVNTGVSGLIDSSGRIDSLVTVGGRVQEVQGHVNATAVLDPRSTLYGRLGETFSIGICIAGGLLLIGVMVPRRAARRIGR